MAVDTDVLIVGAGPVGLWLASELRLAGVGVIMVEEQADRTERSRALIIHPRTLEILASRGLADQVLEEGIAIPSGHFAMLDERLDFSKLDTPFPFTVALLQVRTEEIIEAHVLDAGAEIRRGVRVTGLADQGETARVQLDDGTTLTANWVVGCDGAHSIVRQEAGIEFPGSQQTCVGWLGDVEVADTPGVISVWTLDGTLLGVPIPGEKLYRFAGFAPEDVRTDWPAEDFTLSELSRKVTAITGTDYGMHSPVRLTRYGNKARQAVTYRKGRVILAGDAAHQHMPAGGGGLNVGIQDAMNLGWKLAATINGTAPDWLLDTYHEERHPVGRDLLRDTQAQTGLMAAFTPDGMQMRSLVGELIGRDPELSRDIAERLSGLSVRYARSADADQVVGSHAPNFTLSDGRTLLDALCTGEHVILDFRGTGLSEGAHEVVESGRSEWVDVEAAIIRPDGYVAWAGAHSGLPDALARWNVPRPAHQLPR